MLSETFGRSESCRAEVPPSGAARMTGPLLNLAVLGTTFGVILLAELPDKTAIASLVLGTRYRSSYVFAGVAAAFAAHVVLAILAGSLLGLLPHRALEVIVAVLFAAGAVLILRRRDDQKGDDTDRAGQPAASAGDRAAQPARSPTNRATEPAGSAGEHDGQVAGSAAPSVGAPGEEGQQHRRRRPQTGAVATARNGFWRVAATSFAVLFVAEFGDLTQVLMANLAARYHQPLSVGIGAAAGMWAVGALAIFGGRQLLRLVPLTWINRAAAAVMVTLAVFSLLNAITG